MFLCSVGVSERLRYFAQFGYDHIKQLRFSKVATGRQGSTYTNHVIQVTISIPISDQVIIKSINTLGIFFYKGSHPLFTRFMKITEITM